MHPLEAFKQARAQFKTEQDAPNIERRNALVAAFMEKLRADVRDDVALSLTVELLDEKTKQFKLIAKDHIPIIATQGDAILYRLKRGFTVHMFDHLADALIAGQPLSFPSTKSVLVQSFDTTPTEQPSDADE